MFLTYIICVSIKLFESNSINDKCVGNHNSKGNDQKLECPLIQTHKQIIEQIDYSFYFSNILCYYSHYNIIY